MLAVTRTKFGMPIGDVFFASKDFIASPQAAIWFLVQAHQPRPNLYPVKTQLIDLNDHKDTLFSAMSSNTRYKIKRAEREGLLPSIIPQPTTADLSAYATFFDEFASQKGLPACNLKKMQALGSVDGILLSSISRPTGELLASHAYVKDTETGRLRLLYSASHFRAAADSSERNLIGRANRLLHWHEMYSFKDLGFQHYDLGGIPIDDSDAEKNAIARFKREFGGREITEFSGFIPGTALGKLALALSHRGQV
jgi:hypothetical protein